MHSSDGLVKRMFRKVARTVGATAYVMEKDGEVERDTEACGVPRRERSKRMFIRGLICLKREQRRTLALLPACELCEVSVVIALPVVRNDKMDLF
jgi:hypothetical protein